MTRRADIPSPEPGSIIHVSSLNGREGDGYGVILHESKSGNYWVCRALQVRNGRWDADDWTLVGKEPGFDDAYEVLFDFEVPAEVWAALAKFRLTEGGS